MNWYHSPRTLQALAGAYALGTLAGPARRRFEAVMKQHAPAAQAVAQWNQRFAPLAQRLPQAAPSPELWARIERQTFGVAASQASIPHQAPAATAPVARASATSVRMAPSRAALAQPAWRRWLDSLFSPVPAAALAFGMAFGLALPMAAQWLRPAPAADTELPESYVGVLATAQGKTGLIVSSLRRGTVLDVKRVAAVEVPAGKVLYLWTLDAQGQASAIGALPNGPFVRVALAQPSEALFNKAVELAVSVEEASTRPNTPSAAFVYRGLCGKLWRVPTPAATPAPAASKP